jgi:peptidoglycan/LPS O-acetylase OafA/YrhL
MNPVTSLYLDLIRALAAMVVFLHHGRLGFFSKDQRWLPSTGHEMVVVFFVLSGFVIAYSAERTRDSWRTSAADRLSRLWSVALPALLLTAVLDKIGLRLSPDFYQTQITLDHTPVRFGLAATFLNQSWHLASKPGSNGPYWSLAYEFWYYALFAGWFYARHNVGKVAAVLVFVAFTGWKIAMLLPVWLLGVAVFRICRKRTVPSNVGWAMALMGGLVSFVWAFGFSRIPLLPEGWEAHAPHFFSSRCLPDLFLGVAVSVHVIGLDAALRHLKGPAREHWSHRIVRWASGRSFSLYVFHMPILVFIAGVVPYDPASPWIVTGLLAGTFAAVLVLSELTEQRRDPWRRLLRRFLNAPEKQSRP